MKKQKTELIEMEKRGDKFIPARLHKLVIERKPQQRIKANPIETALTGLLTDFFKMLRREMFK